ADGTGDTVDQPALSDVCCAAERLASLNGTGVIVASFIVTIRLCVSQPLVEPSTAACASSTAAADQIGAFSRVPFASTGRTPVPMSIAYFLTSPQIPIS